MSGEDCVSALYTFPHGCTSDVMLREPSWRDSRHIKLRARALGAQAGTITFLKIGYIGQTHLILVRFSAISNGLQSKNWFHCQDNIARAICVRQSVCIDSTLNYFVQINSRKKSSMHFCLLYVCIMPVESWTDLFKLQITPWNLIILEKRILDKLSLNSEPFMEKKCSSPCIQEPATSLCLEPN